MRKSLFVALSGLFLVTSAHADLVIDNGAKKAPKPVQPQLTIQSGVQSGVQAPEELVSEHVYGKVIEIGTPDKAIQSRLIQGWGDNVALKDALRQVLPSGFSVTPDERLNMDKKVSWEGDQPWVVVLNHMTHMYDFNVTVDWTHRQILVSPVAPPQAHSLAVAQHTTGLTPIVATPVYATSTASTASNMNSNMNSKKLAVTGFKTVSSQPISPAPVEKSWVLNPNQTLKENVEAWGKQAGWTVKWNAVDYKVIAKVVLHGDFTAKNGPIATLMSAYEKADQPLVANLTTMDHVLDVENKNYEPSQVITLDSDPNALNLMDATRSVNDSSNNSSHPKK